MKRNLFVIILVIICGAVCSQTTRIFFEPTTKLGSCRGFEWLSISCGCMNGPNCKHTGIDYCGSETDEIVNVGSGIIVFANNNCNGDRTEPNDNRGLGKTILIKHILTDNSTIYSLYAHLKSINSDVVVGKYIPRGFKIGFKGKTGGGSNGIVHLHFEMKNSIELGTNPKVSDCVGYLKTTENSTTWGYFNPNNYLNIKEYKDIVMDQMLPSAILKSNPNVSIKINNPFNEAGAMDIRLSLLNVTTNAFIESVQTFTNKLINTGSNLIIFNKSLINANPGQYKLQVEYKSPNQTSWIALPTYGSFSNPRIVTLINAQCGSSTLTSTSGTISDGSGNYNYEPNLTCSWIINPSGAAAITINFTQFNTETSYDVVRLKNSAGVTLYTFSGNSIPAPVTIPGNYVKVEFSTDYSVQYSGWSLNYNTILNNGIYKLKHKGTNQCLDVINNSNLPGDNVQQCDDNGTAAQQWVITLESGGFFKLKHKGTNQCLDVAYNSNDNGANVVQYTDNGNDAQRWKIELQSDGAFKLSHKGTSPAKCLDAVNNGNWCGVDVIQYQDNGNDAQRWYFTYLGQNLKDEEAQTRANLVKDNAQQRLEMKISPNPAHVEISIDLNLEDDIPIDLYLYDFSGKIVKSWNSLYPNNGNLNLDIQEIQNGVYLLKTSNHLCSKVVISK